MLGSRTPGAPDRGLSAVQPQSTPGTWKLSPMQSHLAPGGCPQYCVAGSCARPSPGPVTSNVNTLATAAVATIEPSVRTASLNQRQLRFPLICVAERPSTKQMSRCRDGKRRSPTNRSIVAAFSSQSNVSYKQQLRRHEKRRRWDLPADRLATVSGFQDCASLVDLATGAASRRRSGTPKCAHVRSGRHPVRYQETPTWT
jgi:hypothetical protein